MTPSSCRSKLESFLLALQKELARRFRVEGGHPAIERILEEAEAHLEDTVAELIEHGAEEEAAVATALSRFGTPSRVARAYGALAEPSSMPSPWHRLKAVLAGLSEGASDLRRAIRGLGRSPGYSLAFALTLGLGIGANTAIVSALYGVWLRPLPYHEGDRLVYLRHSAKGASVENVLFSVPEIEDYRRESSRFQGVAEFSAMTFTMLGLDEPVRVRAGIVTGNYFEVMGLGARLGRVISSGDDGEAARPVAVLTYDGWHQLFGAGRGVVGKTVTINDQSVEIVGIAEPAPPYPEETNLFVNTVVSPHHLSAAMSRDRVHRMTEVFARLAPDATLSAARAEVEATTRRLHQEHPGAYDPSNGYEVSVVALRDQLAAEARPTLFMLLAVAGFVLVIACANVANLTLAQVMRRHDEWALRVSLGASSWTLRRLLLVENLALSMSGAGLGILLAIGGVDRLKAYIARYSARASEITVDTTVLAVALLVALASACLFALLPRLPRRRPSGTRSTAGAAARRMQRLLVVSQVGVSFVLLVGAGLFLETLRNLKRDDGGVALEEVLSMSLPIDYGARTSDELLAHHDEILKSVQALPGVRSAALGSMIPLKETPHGVLAGLAALEVDIEGRPTEPGAQPPRADFRIVSGDYFHTLGMSVVEGRTFDERDTGDAPKAVVVNRAFADRYFPEGDVVGRRIAWRGDTLHFMGVTQEYRTIVGVVSDAKDYGVAEDVPHVVFNPFTEVPLASSLFVRTAEPERVVEPILERIRELDPRQPIVDVATLAQIRSESISPQRLNATLVGGFALLALTVAAVGVASVLAFGVAQRTHELGVRAAFGADRSKLIRLVLQEGMLLVLFGLGMGLAVSFALAGLVSGLLHGVSPTDVGTLGIVAVLLTLVALLASAVPAWRASHIDPLQALREE